MLKPLLTCIKQTYPYEAAARAERRVHQRNVADANFESHHKVCPLCIDKTFKQIKDYEHECKRGFELAHRASMSHRLVLRK